MALLLPSPEYHARMRADGLTRYDLSEIVAAAADVQAAEREYEAVNSEASQILESRCYLGICWPENPETDYLLPLATILSQMVNTAPATPSLGAYGEMWPVATWRKQARQFRSCASRIQRVMRQIENAA